MTNKVNVKERKIFLMDEVKQSFTYTIVEKETEIDGKVHTEYGIKAINLIDNAIYYKVDNVFCEYDMALDFVEKISAELLEEEQMIYIIEDYLLG